MPRESGPRRKTSQSLVVPEPLRKVPKYNPKNGHIARQGASIFIYGPIRLRPAFHRAKSDLGVLEIKRPEAPISGPAPKIQIVFKNWQAAERFFVGEFTPEDERDCLLHSTGSPNFSSPSMDRAFARMAEKLT